MDGKKTTLKPFLRGRAKFPEGPFALATAFQVPVSFVFAFKESATHYHFYGSSLVKRWNQESKRDFASRLLNSFVQELEEKIKMYPDQWFNYYNFWE